MYSCFSNSEKKIAGANVSAEENSSDLAFADDGVCYCTPGMDSRLPTFTVPFVGCPSCSTVDRRVRLRLLNRVGPPTTTPSRSAARRYGLASLRSPGRPVVRLVTQERLQVRLGFVEAERVALRAASIPSRRASASSGCGTTRRASCASAWSTSATTLRSPGSPCWSWGARSASKTASGLCTGRMRPVPVRWVKNIGRSRPASPYLKHCKA